MRAALAYLLRHILQPEEPKREGPPHRPTSGPYVAARLTPEAAAMLADGDADDPTRAEDDAPLEGSIEARARMANRFAIGR